MRGDKVIARALDGEPATRIIWDTDETIAQVVPEQAVEKLLVGTDYRFFPWYALQDVFEFESSKLKALTAAFGRGDAPEWDSMQHWQSPRGGQE
jgi:hypothetical protein